MEEVGGCCEGWGCGRGSAGDVQEGCRAWVRVPGYRFPLPSVWWAGLVQLGTSFGDDHAAPTLPAHTCVLPAATCRRCSATAARWSATRRASSWQRR